MFLRVYSLFLIFIHFLNVSSIFVEFFMFFHFHFSFSFLFLHFSGFFFIPSCSPFFLFFLSFFHVVNFSFFPFILPCFSFLFFSFSIFHDFFIFFFLFFIFAFLFVFQTFLCFLVLNLLFLFLRLNPQKNRREVPICNLDDLLLWIFDSWALVDTKKWSRVVHLRVTSLSCFSIFRCFLFLLLKKVSLCFSCSWH